MPADTYRSQRRGGKGIVGITTREEDFVEELFITSTHNYILFFTNKGKVYRLKAYQVPEAGRQARGTAIVNLLEIGQDEKITAVIPISEYKKGQYLVMATRKGLIKKTDIMEYDNIRKGGLAAVSLIEDDELIEVKLTDGNQDIILVTSMGMAIRFSESDVRPTGRVSQGVKGISLDDGDSVVGMAVTQATDENESAEGNIEDDMYLLIVTEKGYGKRSRLSEYRKQKRGGKGVMTYKITEKTGNIAGMRLVDEKDDIMLISSDGTIIRLKVSEVSVYGRIAQGVTLMKVEDGSKIMSVARIKPDDDNE